MVDLERLRESEPKLRKMPYSRLDAWTSANRAAGWEIETCRLCPNQTGLPPTASMVAAEGGLLWR